MEGDGYMSVIPQIVTANFAKREGLKEQGVGGTRPCNVYDGLHRGSYSR